MSAPHENEHHPSLNELINKEDYSLSYVTIDNAISLIKKLGRGAWLCKTDLLDAFKQCPPSDKVIPYHGIKWDNKYYFYIRLVFGSRSAPKIFDSISMAVCWILENNYNIEYILHLLDDFLTIDRPDSTPERTMAILTLVFRKLGLPLSQKKTVGTTHVLEYLGIILDSIRMGARLPTEKVSRITEFIEEFLKRKSCTKRELLSLLGHLNYACKVIYPVRAFVSYLIRLSCSVKELHHHIKLSNECCLDLQMWHMFLQTWNGGSFFLDDKETTADELRFYTHATSNTFGAFYNGKWFYGNIEELCSISVEKDDMCRFELYPIVMAAALWGSDWCRKRIIVNCINAMTT